MTKLLRELLPDLPFLAITAELPLVKELRAELLVAVRPPEKTLQLEHSPSGCGDASDLDTDHFRQGHRGGFEQDMDRGQRLIKGNLAYHVRAFDAVKLRERVEQ